MNHQPTLHLSTRWDLGDSVEKLGFIDSNVAAKFELIVEPVISYDSFAQHRLVENIQVIERRRRSLVLLYNILPLHTSTTFS